MQKKKKEKKKRRKNKKQTRKGFYTRAFPINKQQRHRQAMTKDGRGCGGKGLDF